MEDYQTENTYMANGTNNIEERLENAPQAKPTQSGDTYRDSFNKITALLDSLDADARGRILRTIKELYGEDVKKRKRTPQNV